jgi:hypothetical protein
MEKALRFPFSIVGSLGRLSGEKQWECGGRRHVCLTKASGNAGSTTQVLTLYYGYRNPCARGTVNKRKRNRLGKKPPILRGKKPGEVDRNMKFGIWNLDNVTPLRGGNNHQPRGSDTKPLD